MNMHLTKSQIGLDGVPAAETVLSHVDGERGELIIAGERVGDLAGQASFESVTARLWNGATGKTVTEADVRARLGAARERAFARLPQLLTPTQGLSIVDGFRAAVAGLRAENGLDHEATILAHFRSSRARWCSKPGATGRSRPIRTSATRPIRSGCCSARSPRRATWRRSMPISSPCATTA